MQGNLMPRGPFVARPDVDEEHLFALAIEGQEWLEAYEDNLLERMVRWLRDNERHPEYRARSERYHRLWDERWAAWERVDEYLELVAAWGLEKELGPPRCFACECEDHSMATVKAFLRQHGAKARLCARHAVEALAKRKKKEAE